MTAAETYELRFDRPSPVAFPNFVPGVEPVGGEIRVRHEDFVVEEIPLYEFSGEGEFQYATVRKRNRTTLQARDVIARDLGISRDSVGFAGHKDKRAVTTQTFSIFGAKELPVGELSDGVVEVLDVTRHSNKLRPGHLAGNRFKIRVRGIDVDAGVACAQRVFDFVRQHGMPNFYGEQRFGHEERGWKIGEAFLRRDLDLALDLYLGPGEFDEPWRDLYASGEYKGAYDALPGGRAGEAAVLRALDQFGGSAKAAVKRVPKALRKMFYSAFQSYLFNWVLFERMAWDDRDGAAFARPVVGDLCQKMPKGGFFEVLDGELDPATERAARLEISPTGPMFGRKLRGPAGRPGALESAVLDAVGLRLESFQSHARGINLDGTRRTLRALVGDPTVEADPENEAIVLSFSLPAGAFATTLLHPITGIRRRDAAEDDGNLPTESGD